MKNRRQIEKFAKEKLGHQPDDGIGTQFLAEKGYGPTGTPRKGWKAAKRREGR